MARDDMSASGEPVEGVSNRPFAPAPGAGEYQSIPANLDGPLATAHVIHSIPGRVRLRVPSLKAGSQLARGLEALLSTQTGVTEATVNTGCHSVTVVYEPEVWTSESLCMFLHSRSREELEQYASLALADEATATSLLPMDWLQPWRYLNMTGASPGSQGELQTGEQVKSGYWKVGYASMVVGAVLVPVPLVPGIPFLILASYCFAKATIWKPGVGPEAGAQVPKVKE
jgi:Heavy metal associated domain 2